MHQPGFIHCGGGCTLVTNASDSEDRGHCGRKGENFDRKPNPDSYGTLHSSSTLPSEMLAPLQYMVYKIASTPAEPAPLQYTTSG